jgi:hypothetical protein
VIVGKVVVIHCSKCIAEAHDYLMLLHIFLPALTGNLNVHFATDAKVSRPPPGKHTK